MRSLATSSNKGGVGKTSLAGTLGVGLAPANVLLVDLDPRGDLTSNLGIRGDDQRNDLGKHLVDVLLHGAAIKPVTCEWQEPWESDTHVQLPRHGLQLLAGGRLLDQVSTHLAGLGNRIALNAVLNQASQLGFKYVIFDVPPGDRRTQAQVLDVVTDVLVPVGADLNALRGLADIARVVGERRQNNPALKLTGVVLYGLNPTASAQRREAREDAEAALNGAAPVLNTVIRSSVEYARAVRAGVTAGEWRTYLQLQDGFSAAKPVRMLAWDFEQLLDELLYLWGQEQEH